MRGIIGAMLVAGISLVFVSCKNNKASSEKGLSDPLTSVEIVPDELPMKPQDSLLTFYSRSPCFGMCPVFDLWVYQNGQVIFRGRNFVNHIGYYHTTWQPAALHKILHVSDSIGYFSMQDVYDEERVTDLPSVMTTVVKDNTRKDVRNRYRGPKALQALYQALDDQIAASDWKPLNDFPPGWKNEE